MPSDVDLPETTKIRRALLAWYDGVARDLPWRRTHDPYAIWVAEVMLQQTRVETVVPYYERFLRRFPDVASLAGSPADEVLAAWSGLGYYRRARLLHAGALHVAERHGGAVPGDLDALRAIPGVGAYTAGAIGSQAFGLEAAVVDGNVARFVARLCAIEDDVKRGAGLGRAWRVAEALVRGERPGALNNALMEIGATICVPREPRCFVCPVRAWCGARTEGRERALPVATVRGERPRVLEAAALLRQRGDRSGRYVMVRCASPGLFGGMWEAPRVAIGADTSPRAITARAPSRAIAALFSRLLGVPVSLERAPAARVEHVLTHRVLDVQVFRGNVATTPPPIVEMPPEDRGPERMGDRGSRYDAVDLLAPGDLDGRGVSTMARRILAAAGPTDATVRRARRG